MRNPIYVLKSLEENACNKSYQYERLYRNLYNPEFYLLAYKNIASSQGSMTAGVDGKTLDGMSMARINNIIAMLKDHSYQPNPARRKYIEKKNSTKQRPLGIPSTDDKLVQEIIRMILEAIFEPTFSENSHGFRPNRSCHTALTQIQNCFTGIKWIIEGDIKACFDSFDHHILINLLRQRIKDEYFISLMWKFLRAGYMEQWEYRKTYSGTPQGSGMSPILANIYLSELDKYMEEYKQRFDSAAKCGTRNAEYRSLSEGYYSKCKKKLREETADRQTVREFKAAQKRLFTTPYTLAIDPSFTRIQYNRYADDFVIGVIGSKDDALRIKADVKQFLCDKLKLTLSEEKTKVTHSSEMVRYLGYDFTVSRDKNTRRRKDGHLMRMFYGNVALYVPKEKWFDKLQEYNALKITKDENGNERWKPLHRGKLINKPEVEIIRKYNSEIRGIYNYYRMARNATVLDDFYYIMKGSMLKTFANKYKSSINKILAKYEHDGVFRVPYTNKAGKQLCEFYHDGFARKEQPVVSVYLDVLPQHRKYDKVNSFARRLRAGICELCGTETSDVRILHVRTLKELTGKTPGEKLMMEKRRKSLALCPNCFEKEHAEIF